MATNNAQTLTIGGVTYQIEDVGARQLISSLQTALNSLTSGNTTTAIESFNEIIAFLENVSDSSTLQGIIAGLNTSIAAKYTKPGTGIPASDLAQAVQTILNDVANKVDAVNGKGLSTNDYTDTEKTKLAGIAAGAQVNVINGIKDHGASTNLPVTNGVVELPEQTEVDLSDYYDKDEVDALIDNIPAGPKGEQGPKGDQGNSGVASADGIESVNNLNGGTTDTAEKVYVLGANMGKELGDRLKVLEGYNLEYTKDVNNDTSGQYIFSTGNVYGGYGWSVSRPIPLEEGEKLTITIQTNTIDTGKCVLGFNTTGVLGTFDANHRKPFVANQTEYEFTAEENCYVFVCYKTADGFTATTHIKSPSEVNAKSIAQLGQSVSGIDEKLGGVEIPFRSTIGYYKYANNTLTEVTASSGAENALFHYHTEPITLADYKALFFTGGMNKDNAYFCAVFFDGNGDFLSTGLGPIKSTNDVGEARCIMHNVLDEAPNGAVTVVLQSDQRFTGTQVIGFTDYPYHLIQNKWWRWDSFGIKGDGVTDDTVALQDYISSSGGYAELKPGKYRITAPLYIKTTQVRKIVGNGATIIIDADNYASGAAVIGFDIVGDHTGAADPDKTSTQMFNAGFVMEDVHITSKTGLAWHDNQTGSDVGKGLAIRIRTTNMLTLRGCEIYSVNDGVELYGGNRNTVIDGCFIYNCWNNGIVFASNSDLHQINIVGCHISYCKTLIFFDNPQQINNYQISGCDLECSRIYPYGVTEGTKCCIKLVSTKEIMNGQIEITGNTIQAHASRENNGGIDAEYLIDIESITTNRIANFISIVGNHMSNVGQYAIRINGGDQYTIVGNTVGNTGGSATSQNDLTGGLLYLEGTVSDIAVTGNTLRNFYNIVKDAYMVNVDEDASVTRLAVTGNVGNNTPISIDGASQDYISVVGNCLGGGAVTIGDATHKQEANNI